MIKKLSLIAQPCNERKENNVVKIEGSVFTLHKLDKVIWGGSIMCILD